MSLEPIHPLIASTEQVLEHETNILNPEGECVVNGHLSAATKTATAKIAEALFSSDEQAMPAARLSWLVREYSDFMSRAPAKGRLLFTLATMVVSVLSPLLINKLPPFSRLSFDDRILALRALEASRFGKILIPLRAILCLIYYEHPEAAVIIGLPDQAERLVTLGKK